RYIELWNLVFMQYDHKEDGQLVPLPARHVDTGMGFERIVGVLQGASSNFETDLFRPIIVRLRDMLNADEAALSAGQVSFRLIADHIRAVTFLVGDGVLPGNEGRGYVLRLILRRAARHGRLLGFDEPFLATLAETVIDLMGDPYRELIDRREFILSTIRQEESRFSQTLTSGMALVDDLISGLRARGETIIPGEDAFRLYDTHGFPVDLTRDIARDFGLTVDLEGYRRALDEQKKRARASAQFGAEDTLDAQAFVELLQKLKAEHLLAPAGVEMRYDAELEIESRIISLLRDGHPITTAHAGDRVDVVLPETPFYVESGGQVADTGVIARYRTAEDRKPLWEIRIDDVRRPVAGLVLHSGEVLSGSPTVGEPAWAAVDIGRRMDVMRNHTATHLLDTELRYVLGKHVQQAGSVVEPDRLRFDFTHPSMLRQDELDLLEQSINDAILADYPVETEQTTYRQAVADGAIAIFTEKYGEEVRVVKIGWEDEEFSKELCGGTHVQHTGQIGLFHIVSEESIGAGVRRIEAVTGRAAQEFVQRRLKIGDQVAAFLRVSPDQLERAVHSLYGELQASQKEIANLRSQLAMQQTDRLAAGALRVGDVAVVAAEVAGADVQTLRDMSDQLRTLLGSAVVVLAAAIDDKPQMIAAVTDDLVKRGVHAGQLVKALAKSVGGGGGGKPALAQAGGRDLERLPDALALVPELVRSQLE
ncbi:MAG: alanine--tRNA ligase, partial [Anaerolineae bacterium]